MHRTLTYLLPLGVAVLVLALARTAPFERLEELTLDIRFSSYPRPDLADTNVIIAAIDNGSLDIFAENGLNWPWSRDTYAFAIRRMEQAGTRAILFDLLFFDADIERVEIDPRLTDAQFARALAASPGSVLGAELIPGRDGRFADARMPLPLFTDSARYVGATNIIPDAGGVIRNVDLWHDLGGGPFPSIALATRMAADPAESGWLELPPRHRIHWYGPPGPGGTFRYIPFSALLFAPEDSLTFLAGKTVVVGVYASGLLDFKPTPMSAGGAYPGMEIWATVLSNLKQDDFIRPLPGWVEFGFILFMALGTALLFRLPSATGAAAAVLVLQVGFVAISLHVWAAHRIPLPMTAPMLAGLLTYAAVAVVSFLREGRSKREIRAIFSRYVHPDVIESLTAEPDTIRFGGDLVQATILFTDIADFTTYSESKKADALVADLNGYLSDLAEMVLDEGGLLDKFTGDGIMALFGVPVARGNHAEMACRAALRHQAFTGALSDASHPAQTFFHRNTRIGINSGDIIAGNIGSARRMDYTAIGDDVNLAARLEGVNKVYGTRILIGENTRALLGASFIVREIDSITVKGKARAVRIFELLGETGDPVDPVGIKTYESALDLYRRGAFAEAGARFRSLPDTASAVMADRCEHLTTSPPSDWDGVYNLTSK